MISGNTDDKHAVSSINDTAVCRIIGKVDGWIPESFSPLVIASERYVPVGLSALRLSDMQSLEGLVFVYSLEEEAVIYSVYSNLICMCIIIIPNIFSNSLLWVYLILF